MQLYKFLKAKEIVSELETLGKELKSYEESTNSESFDFYNSQSKTIKVRLTSEEFDFIKKSRIESIKEKISSLEYQFKIL